MTKEQTRAIKLRCFQKKYADAEVIQCECGCGETLKSCDHYGRRQRYINGHNGRKYDDPKQYKREWRNRNRESRRAAKVVRYRMLKVKVIKLKGSACAMCGKAYNGKNAPIFEFHHREPGKKEHQIAHMLLNRAFSKVLLELDKCDLICSNCHNQLHAEEF